MNHLSDSDPDLIRSTIAGDQAAFQIFVERYQKPIFSYLYRFLYQNREAAEDIAQTVFLKIYQNLNSIDPEKPIASWVFRIAHNEAANYLRTVSRRKESLMDDERWSKIADRKDRIGNSEEEEYSDLIQRALKKIKPQYREVIVLFYFEEKSYKEIATILNSSTNTVGTLVRRAKQQLKKILERMAPDLASLLMTLLALRQG